MEENHNEQAIVAVDTPRDWESYRRYYWYMTMRHPATAILYVMFFALVPIFFLYLVIGFSFTRELDLLMEWIRYFALWGIYVAYLLVRPCFLFRRRRKRFAKENTTHVFYESHTTTAFQNENILSNSSDYSYDYFKGARETRHMFFMRAKSGGYFFIGKKFLASDQSAALRALFARKFGDKFNQYKQK